MFGRSNYLIDGALKNSFYKGDHFSNNYQYILDFNESQKQVPTFPIKKKKVKQEETFPIFEENNKTKASRDTKGQNSSMNTHTRTRTPLRKGREGGRGGDWKNGEMVKWSNRLLFSSGAFS